MRTIREQLRGYMLDFASNIVYNAGNAESTHLWWPGALPYLPYISRKPHSYSAVFNMFWDRISGTFDKTPLTQECVKGAQTGQRKQSNACSMLTRLRKGHLNSVVMRKVTCLKETTYGKNYGRL